MSPADAKRVIRDIARDKARCPNTLDSADLALAVMAINRLELELRAARAALQWTETHAQKAQRLGTAKACRKLVEQLCTSAELVEAMRSAS